MCEGGIIYSEGVRSVSLYGMNKLIWGRSFPLQSSECTNGEVRTFAR